MFLASCTNSSEKTANIGIEKEPELNITEQPAENQTNESFNYGDYFTKEVFTIPGRSCAYHIFSLGGYNLTARIILNASREVDVYFVSDVSSEFGHCINREKIRTQYAEYLVKGIDVLYNTTPGSGFLISTKSKGDNTNVTFIVLYLNE